MDRTYELKLLTGWEEVFKKGQLTLWIMLALKDGPKHMAAIKDFIEVATDNSLSADNQSMYRALRRYHNVDMVGYVQEAGKSGADRKVYNLTETGARVLQSFVERNISNVFYKPSIKELIEKDF